RGSRYWSLTMDLFRRLFSQSNAKPQDGDQAVPDKPKDTAKAEPLVMETRPVSPPATEPLMPSSLADGATRPLPPETVISTSKEHLVFGQATDVGMVRTNNQDSVFSFLGTSRSADQRPDFGLFVVADGMGGHHDGEKASAITANMVTSYVMN